MYRAKRIHFQEKEERKGNEENEPRRQKRFYKLIHSFLLSILLQNVPTILV